MATLPPINVWRQRVKAMEQLTMRPTSLGSGGEASWGRKIYMSYPTAVVPDINTSSLVATTHPDNLSITGPTIGYCCDTVHPTHNGIWRATTNDENEVTFRQGLTQAAIKDFHDNLKATGNYYLLKDTAAGALPGNYNCWANVADYRTMWYHTVPVENEHLVEITTPVVNSIGCEVSTAAVGLNNDAYVQASFEINGCTRAEPTAFAYLRPESTILGAWAQVYLEDLSVQTTINNWSGHTTQDGAGNWSWTQDSSTGTDTTTDEAVLSWIVVAIRASDGYPVVIGSQAIDSANIGKDEWTWMDLTETFSAMFAHWNGPYTSFHVLPYCDSWQHALSDAEAGDGYLARLLPSVTRSAVLDDNGCDSCTSASAAPGDSHPVSMEYAVTCKKITFTSLSFQNAYIAVQLPSETTDVLLNYSDYPTLA